ncbi:BRO1-like domain-containing protein [Mycotypha africana]|uniref:BRO1-like domain-containing protein n=1 Tax=Mycotypha africana TaxID=64632 RepID=UPI002301B124|nr:BRO1-like domain-containing protein [Mycotypha africana]KAI8991547.1 BRO1-like domain-containing protein [Mycotypha africana]
MRISPTVDLSPSALQTLIHLMLAQAQECVWQKAAMDGLRDGTIARLALKIAEYYNTAVEFASNSSLQALYSRHWIIHMQIKSNHFTAAAQFRKASECISQDKYGEEIARLQLASDVVKKAFHLISSSSAAAKEIPKPVINDLKSLQQIIATNLARAEKDNDVIYLEKIPSVSALPKILKTEMVKPVPPAEVADPVLIIHQQQQQEQSQITKAPHPVIGLPLFRKLVPFAVHQAASVYIDRKERLIKEDIIAKLEELTIVYHRSATEKNASKPSTLPDYILQQAAEVRSEGGSQILYEMWDHVQAAASKNSDILEEAFNALDEEYEVDESYRSKYTNEWKRPESLVLTQQLTTQGQKHRETITAAQKADLIVRNKLDTWANIIDVLTLPLEDLENSIPSASPSIRVETAQEDSQKLALARIKTLTDNMNQHIRLRKNTIEQAKKASNADDISTSLIKKADELTAQSPLIKIEAAQFEELFIEELRKYDKFLLTVDEEDEAQSEIIKQLNEAYKQFQTAASNGKNFAVGSAESIPIDSNLPMAKREKALQNLSQAYLKFKEIKTNLSEGLKVTL